VAGGSPSLAPLVAAGVRAAHLPPGVRIVHVAGAGALRHEVANGTLQGGVIVPAALGPLGEPAPGSFGSTGQLARLLKPALDPGTDAVGGGLQVVPAPGSLLGTNAASDVAAGIAAQAYAGALSEVAHGGGSSGGPGAAVAASDAVGAATRPLVLSIRNETIGSGAKHVLDYYAPSITVIFVFIGAGLGTRSLLLERSEGTLARLAAAPVRPTAVVIGKMLAIGLTALATILVAWGATSLVFGADWGSPQGVFLVSCAAALAVCAVATFLTSFARNEQEAYGVAMMGGLLLALLGGSLVPPGALPHLVQVLSLGTPNGWAAVAYGRLALEGEGTRSVLGPLLVLCAIALGFGLLAATRFRRMVQP